MSRQKIIEFWGDHLKPVPAEMLQEVNLPYDTKLFLHEVGLPEDDRLDDYTKLRMVLESSNVRSFYYKYREYVRIGYINLEWSNSVFCIDADMGTVHTLSLDDDVQDNAPDFVNADIERFLLSLIKVLEYTPELKRLAYLCDDLYQHRVTPEEAKAPEYIGVIDKYYGLVDQLQYELHSIDARAIRRMETHYWSQVMFDWST